VICDYKVSQLSRSEIRRDFSSVATNSVLRLWQLTSLTALNM